MTLTRSGPGLDRNRDELGAAGHLHGSIRLRNGRSRAPLSEPAGARDRRAQNEQD